MRFEHIQNFLRTVFSVSPGRVLRSISMEQVLGTILGCTTRMTPILIVGLPINGCCFSFSYHCTQERPLFEPPVDCTFTQVGRCSGRLPDHLELPTKSPLCAVMICSLVGSPTIARSAWPIPCVVREPLCKCSSSITQKDDFRTLKTLLRFLRVGKVYESMQQCTSLCRTFYVR